MNTKNINTPVVEYKKRSKEYFSKEINNTIPERFCTYILEKEVVKKPELKRVGKNILKRVNLNNLWLSDNKK